MQTQPPWGTILAIDLRTGEKKWEASLGYMMDPQKYPEASHWGSLNFGGAITTAGNLTFVAATFDNHLRAFNTQTGELLWESELPASAQATPMTYVWKGKQYIVIAAGGHGKLGTKQGDSVVAFALECAIAEIMFRGKTAYPKLEASGMLFFYTFCITSIIFPLPAAHLQ